MLFLCPLSHTWSPTRPGFAATTQMGAEASAQQLCWKRWGSLWLIWSSYRTYLKQPKITVISRRSLLHHLKVWDLIITTNSFRVQPQKHDTLSKDLGCLILKLKLSLQVFFQSIIIFSPLSRSGQTPEVRGEGCSAYTAGSSCWAGVWRASRFSSASSKIILTNLQNVFIYKFPFYKTEESNQKW